MFKLQPPEPPLAKEPTPTLKDLVPKNETRVRCYNKSFLVDLILDENRAKKSTTFESVQKRSFDVSESDEGEIGDMNSTNQKRDLLIATRKEAQERRESLLKAQVRRNAKLKEENFMSTYAKLNLETKTFVADLDQYLDNKRRAQVQKRRTLHTEWKECVFDKIQDQLLNRVDDMNGETIADKRRQLFQNYIDAARRKGGRLFLDIVIENEYDPFTWKKDLLRYRAKPATVSNGPGFTDRFGNPVFDPTMRDLEKHRSEARAAREVGGGGAGAPASPGGAGGTRLGRETLGHEHWSKMEATPYFDRAARVQDLVAAGIRPPVRAGVQSRVRLDDFEYRTGPDVLTREFQGLFSRGERVWRDCTGKPAPAMPFPFSGALISVSSEQPEGGWIQGVSEAKQLPLKQHH
jgi:hypothetical protein